MRICSSISKLLQDLCNCFLMNLLFIFFLLLKELSASLRDTYAINIEKVVGLHFKARHDCCHPRSVLRPKGAGSGGWQVEGKVGPLLNDAEHHTCLCWQPFSPGLPPVLLLGTTTGAKVGYFPVFDALPRFHQSTHSRLPVSLMCHYALQTRVVK